MSAYRFSNAALPYIVSLLQSKTYPMLPADIRDSLGDNGVDLQEWQSGDRKFRLKVVMAAMEKGLFGKTIARMRDPVTDKWIYYDANSTILHNLPVKAKKRKISNGNATSIYYDPANKQTAQCAEKAQACDAAAEQGLPEQKTSASLQGGDPVNDVLLAVKTAIKESTSTLVVAVEQDRRVKARDILDAIDFLIGLREGIEDYRNRNSCAVAF